MLVTITTQIHDNNDDKYPLNLAIKPKSFFQLRISFKFCASLTGFILKAIIHRFFFIVLDKYISSHVTES